ncbi:hypothetical protein [Brevibacillus laterosporus]|uniref:hypothetical protein n=1 Tax=Brevibacillus laterosporus TaxID=1465 RepID=UPI00264BDCEC|nr:hypothetical protein [Brevibacillus laterosporus]MDN9010030.1 hypothetical protein [Brevibacillus laterosporus]MDO0940588.1 hypothetical protein [Brevibacillus laterosporus]
METIIHEGKLYRKAARDAKPGDEFIQITKSRRNLTQGKVYMIAGFDSFGDAEFYDDAGRCRDSSLQNYVVLEPLTKQEPITLISTTPAVEKTYTIQLTAGAVDELIRTLSYGTLLRSQFEAIRKS